MKKLNLIPFLFIFCIGCEGAFYPSFNLSPSFDQIKQTVIVCHMQEDSSFVSLEIHKSTLSTHLAHGDYHLDVDQDGFTAYGACDGSKDDCDDENELIHPNAIEFCGDIIDNNCDGHINEGCMACEPPELEMPEDLAILDNGCQDRSDSLIWKFQWEECQEASQYQLYVKRESAQTPFIETKTKQTQYEFVLRGDFVEEANILDWKWKVRTLVHGIWTRWSEIRTFEVEPLDTDCP